MLADIRQIGFDHVEGVSSSKLYFLAGTLPEGEVRLVAEELLADPVAEVFDFGAGFSKRAAGLSPRGVRQTAYSAAEIHTLPGVMDPVALSTLAAARRLLSRKGADQSEILAVSTARRYEIVGASDAAELETIAASVLANACIERWYIQGFDRDDTIPDKFPTPPDRPFCVRTVPLCSLNDDELERFSRDAHLFLSLDEMRTIRDHFAGLGREPTDLEVETLAQTWSEHCVHKTLKSEINYRGDDFGRPGQVEVHYDNLLKDTIVAATATLDRDWCLSVFVDNAGIIAFDDEYGIAFKAETHNHPSAIEPYGGAATGIGGCIRDIMGCGLGAKPIASTDVFCLAPPNFDSAKLPKDVHHPRRILKGVVGGVRDYGNRMGIPTVNGAIYFDERYLANPLVFCGCVGLIPRDRIDKEPRPGDRIVVAGGRTGRDGIHGATFSSAELTDTHADEFSHAVQIGNAIEEKKLLDAQLLARDHPDGCLYSSVTDCGAGGLSSAVGEMAEQLGAVVELDTVPLKYAGLSYDEIWISEAQERMVYAVDPGKLDTFLKLFADEEVEATVIGTFADDGILRVRHNGQTVGELDMAFLHEGLPKSVRTATWTATGRPNDCARTVAYGFSSGDKHGLETRATDKHGLETRGTCEEHDVCANDRLLRALGDLNTASKEWVIRQYDHEVQGRSVIKPLCGPKSGPSDAAVLRPRYDRDRGIAIGCGLCPDLGDIDPYLMAIAAVDEALRNIICVGANPDVTAILDNFCWPKVDTEEALGALVRACQGAKDAAIAYGLPFVSGKDSLNNEFSMSADEAARVGLPSQIAIPYTLLISALGIVDDVRRCISMDLKEVGNRLVLASAPVERVGLAEAKGMHDRVAGLITSGKVRSAHDVSDGGLAVAIAEMCIAAEVGAKVSINEETALDALFTPTGTTYVLEMSDGDAAESGLPIIGRVEGTNGGSPRLRIHHGDADVVDLPVADLADAWKRPLAQGGGL